MNLGYVRVGDQDYIFPQTSKVLFPERDHYAYLRSIQSVYNVMLSGNTRLKVHNDGVNFALTNFGSKKTASFRDEADLTLHLMSKYAMDQEACQKLIQKGDVIVFTKEAFTPQAQMESQGTQEQPGQGWGTTGYAPQNPMVVDADMLESSAGMGDQEMFDTGMLASLAGNEDIKGLLTGFLPQFSETTTNLGKSILSFTINKKDIEETYGREQYNTLLGAVRKVFKLLGGIVYDLKFYNRMAD
jgi:hypothetical protein